MFKVEIKRLSDNLVTHMQNFYNLNEANDWILKIESLQNNPWGIPGTYEVVITDITIEHSLQSSRMEKIRIGRIDRTKCENALDLIAGYNRDRELTMEQITYMQSTFSNAEAALRASRPDYAKSFIEGINPDDVLITSQMKADVLEILG